MKSIHSFLSLLIKLFRHFSPFEKIIAGFLFAVIGISIAKLIIPFVLEISFEYGGIYGEGLVGKPRLLNPVFVEFNDVDRDISSLIFSGLMKYDPETQNFVPDLAEAIERGHDRLTYFVHLKKNILWHDEKPFTADDVYFTFKEVIQDPGLKNSFLHEAFSDVKIEKVDEDTVSFTLPEENSFFVSFLTVGVLPAHLLRGTSIAEVERHPFNKNPVGTGPFAFANTQEPIDETTSSLTLVRFGDYYGRKANVKSVRFSFFPTWSELLRKRESLSGIPKLSGELRIPSKNQRLLSQSYKLNQYMAVFFNLERPLLSQKRFRQVLMKSIQKEKLKELLRENIEVIDTPYFQRREKDWINQYDPKAAAVILQELGFRKGEDGFLRNSKDQVPTLTLLARFIPDAPQEKEIELAANFLRDQWQAMGIRLIIRREESENFSILVRQREYDLLLLGQNLGYNNDLFAFWHSSQRSEKGLNLSQLRSFKVDSILEDLRQIFDSKKKAKRLQDLEAALSDEMPALFLYTPLYGFAIDKKISGFPEARFAFPSDRFAHIEKVAIAK